MTMNLEKALWNATTDPLTGIPNRRTFENDFTRLVKLMERENKPLALLFIDIDHFKAYNDHHGHAGGDLCLQSVAHALRRHCSRPGDLVCRWGGEEFAVILPGTVSAGAAHLARDLVQKVQALAIQHGQSPIADQVTISVGSAATWPKDCENPKALLERADEALYQAKQSGRNRAVEAE
jgi:diguanylate cyclase (GGDEF)-like protein